LTVRSIGRGVQPIIELARVVWPASRKLEPFVLLNGDGFEDRLLQNVQAQLRARVQNSFPRVDMRMVIPYAAMNAARLDPSTIEPIHVSTDRQVSNRVVVPKPSEALMAANRISGKNVTGTGQEFLWRGRLYRFRSWSWQPHQALEIMHQPDFAPMAAWHQIEDLSQETYLVVERMHRLGESVFWAVDGNGERHRWLSGFDQLENPAMYFLAQLPDKGGVRYITHAIRLLAPPIVHKARKEGRRVFRQGDIFAVETDMTSDDLRDHRAYYRAELFGTGNGGLSPFASTDAGYRLRQKLMIYGTGHTATEVIPTPRGTFVRGTMFHDPILENIRANRPPEHRQVEMDSNAWFLAVRNTVPRLSDNNS
jgi:hypothetical protein